MKTYCKILPLLLSVVMLMVTFTASAINNPIHIFIKLFAR